MAKSKPVVPCSPEAELAGLVATRTTLQARQSALAVEVEQAVATRRRLLIEGGDASAIADAERACREIEGTAYGIIDALAEIERRIGEIETRIEAARSHAERERVAASLERNATEIQTATAALAKALDAVAKAHTTLAVTVGDTAAPQFAPYSGVDSPTGVANALMMQGLVSTLSSLGIVAQLRDMSPYSLMLPVEPADPTETAAAFGERLRETARQVRAGETDVDLPAHQEAEPDFTPENPELQVYVLTPFSYIGAHRGRVMVAGATASLPVPVAEKAIEVGVASEAPTREWQKAENRSGSLTEVHARPSVSWEECVNIGFDLAAWRRAEAERRREAWRAERQPEAA